MASIQHNRRLGVLGLAGVASLLELGPIAGLLYWHQGILPVLAAGLAYQVGNLMPRPAVITGRLAIGIAASLGATLLLFIPLAHPLWFFAIAVLSWTLQAVRRNITAKEGSDLPTTAQKRGARVAGFVVATLTPMPIWLALVLLAIAVTLPLVHPRTDSISRDRRIVGHRLEWTMLFHQTHYFSYAYAVPLLVASPALGGVPLTGVWFAFGWVSYLSAETLWRRLPPFPVFIGGHLFLTIVLVLLTLMSAAPWVSVALWILSGFGGGTVYCLALLHKRERLPHTNLERAEDAGHLLGVTFALACVYFLNWSANLLPAMGSAWAFVAALSMVTVVFSSRQGRTNVISSQGASDAN